MSEYIVDKRDMQFVLFEQLDIESLTKLPRYSDFEREDFDMVLTEGIKVAQELLAPLNKSGDETGCTLKDGQVHLPAGFDAAYKRFCRDGWAVPQGDPEFGGQGLPISLTVGVMEAFIGANSSFMFLPGLTSAAGHVLESFGSPEQKALYIKNMYTGKWTGTMCLTEPQAGTAVGEASTVASEVEGEDYFLIKGNKIFISNGDHTAAENIIHLVLARVPGDPAGTKGLSLFIVPKYRIDAQGNLGERNDVNVPGIEHKMGINGSPTCQLAFGDEDACQGFLIGERRMGIVYMFQMMNEARITCGIQGSALGGAAYQYALGYARERIQGAKVTDRSKNPTDVAIIEHPDVRRNLMIMKSMSEGLRVLVLQTAKYADLAMYAEDEGVRVMHHGLLELLTPILKAYATDQGFWVTERAIQVYGGYGFIREYPVEQTMRDLKIASLYEGTNGVQALDLLGRKLRLKGGALFMAYMQMVNDQLAEAKKYEPTLALAEAVDKAKNALAQVVFALPGLGKKNPELAILQATPFLEMFGHVEVARLLLDQAIIADKRLSERIEAAGAGANAETVREHLENDSESRFYQGKVKGATFFIQNILPLAHTLKRTIIGGDSSPLDIVF